MGLRAECGILYKASAFVGLCLKAKNITAEQFCQSFIQNAYEKDGSFGFVDSQLKADEFSFYNPDFSTITFQIPKKARGNRAHWIPSLRFYELRTKEETELILTSDRNQEWDELVPMVQIEE